VSVSRIVRADDAETIISHGMRRQVHYFGYLPDGSLDALVATLAVSPEWMLFYRNSDVVIYQLVR